MIRNMRYCKTLTKCRPISAASICSLEFQLKLKGLQDALDADPLVISIAAPQIGWDAQVFVVRKQRDIGGIYINPVVESIGDQLIAAREGCISLPYNKQVIKSRQLSVHMTWLNVYGNIQDRAFHGLAARIIQHETDQLRGVMINDVE